MNADYQAFHADRLALESRVDDILIAALLRPLTIDEVIDLRSLAGITDRRAKKAPSQAECDLENLPF